MISMLLPTRKRPERFRKSLESCIDTADDPKDLEFMVYVDNDDDLTQAENIELENLKIFRGERMSGSARMSNYLADRSVGEVVGYWADDIVMLTKGWDSKVKSLFTGDKIWLPYPTNIKRKKDLAVHGFLSRQAIALLGSMWPPEFASYHSDKFMWEIYQELGRLVKMKDVLISHEHPYFGFPQYWDDTYSDNISNKGRMRLDKKVYKSLKSKGKWVKRLKKHIAKSGGS